MQEAKIQTPLLWGCAVFMLLLTASVSAKVTLFDADELISLRLTAPLSTIYRDRDKSKVYPNADLTYVNTNGETVRLKVGIQVRGYFRLNKRNCSNPPLKIIFDKNKPKILCSLNKVR